MKIRKQVRNLLCALAVIISVGGFATVVYAGNVPLDVTASNVASVGSKDPYSRKEGKSDSDQNFYIKLTSLTNGPSMSFTSYSSAGKQVSGALTISKSQLNSTRKKAYNKTVYANKKYYVYSLPPRGYTNVHAVGTYCP